jgi:SAM-dependent methyltransferase
LEILQGLAGTGTLVVGVDLAALASRRGPQSGARVCAGDVVALPFADAAFDACWCNGVLHHLTDPDRAVAELARVLRAGGLAVVIVYNAWHPYFYLLHRAAWPLRALYWRGQQWPFRLVRALSGWLLRLVLRRWTGSTPSVAELDSIVLDQVFAPLSRLYTARGLRRLLATAGLQPIRTWRDQLGLMRGALCRKAAREQGASHHTSRDSKTLPEDRETCSMSSSR